MMGRDIVRPIVLPLSNPTPRAECVPKDAVEWTGGRALIGTGSPFAPVQYGEASIDIAQVNNVSVFPGLGLGVIASRAARVTDTMITAASLAVAEEAIRVDSLVPPIEESIEVARAVAVAVARQAMRDGVADRIISTALEARIDEVRWIPEYR